MAESNLGDLERRLFDPDARVDGDEIEAADLGVLVTLSEEAGEPHELWLHTSMPNRIEWKVGELLVIEGGEFVTVLAFVVRPGLSRGLIEFILSQTARYRELIYQPAAWTRRNAPAADADPPRRWPTASTEPRKPVHHPMRQASGSRGTACKPHPRITALRG